MTVEQADFEVDTRGDGHVLDLTPDITETVSGTGIRDGLVCVFVAGSTAALSTVEYEPGLSQDLQEFFDRVIPPGDYHHHETWNDGNGHSHVRATLVGPSLTIPLREGQMILGTWQQVILLDFDNRSRRRRVLVQVVGE